MFNGKSHFFRHRNGPGPVLMVMVLSPIAQLFVPFPCYPFFMPPKLDFKTTSQTCLLLVQASNSATLINDVSDMILIPSWCILTAWYFDVFDIIWVPFFTFRKLFHYFSEHGLHVEVGSTILEIVTKHFESKASLLRCRNESDRRWFHKVFGSCRSVVRSHLWSNCYTTK